MKQKLILGINRGKATASIDTAAYRNKFGFAHYGTDIVSAAGNRLVYCSGIGTVKKVGWDTNAGWVVSIVYPNAYNWKTKKYQDVNFRHYHLDVVRVVVGQKVTKDTVLGYYGTTGKYSGNGAHLHTEADYDTRDKYLLYTPTYSKSDFLVGTSQGAYAWSNPLNTCFNVCNVLHVKTDSEDYQTWTTANDIFIRDEDKNLPTVTEKTYLIQ